ncbi:hypothetical protein ACSTLM_00880, partial [Vibrio parahaemolyticus]
NTVTLALLLATTTPAATYRTPNFVVEAPTPEVAKQAALVAEQHRREQALAWLDRELPPWPEPCRISVKITTTGSGGST